MSITPDVDFLNLHVGETQSFTVTLQDASGATLQGRAVTWSSDDPAVVTVSSTGLVTAIGPGSADVSATSEGQSDAVEIEVLVTPDFLEVDAFARITDRDFSTKSVADNDRTHGWDGVEHKFGWQVVSVGSAPISADKVGRWTYREGTSGGSSPDGLAQIFWAAGQLPDGTPFTTSAKTLYLRFALRLSEGFQGHATSTNKLIHLWGKDWGNRVFLDARGSADDPLRFAIRRQGGPDDERIRFGTTEFSDELERGRWYIVELMIEINDPGLKNGTAYAWIDGLLTHQYDDLEIVAAGETAEFGQIQISPTWGGGGDTVLEDFHLDIDHLFASAD